MMEARFSRQAFETSADTEELCDALSSVVLSRLISATEPAVEVQAVVAELRAIGHQIWSWDESPDFSIWGDDYNNPPAKERFLIEMHWPEPDWSDEDAEFGVEVTFGPWPSESEGRPT